MEFPPPGPVHVQCIHARKNTESLPPEARAVVERTSSNRVDCGELGIDEVQRADLRETRRMTKRRALFTPEIVLQGVLFPVSEVPLYRGELYDTYRGTSPIRNTCSP